MSYSAPEVTSAGLVLPTYVDIREDILESYKEIYGQDCYLEQDSADYQWISIVSLRMFHAIQSVQLAYNNRSPNTAVGSGLDQIVALNGIRRKTATYSTCLVTLTGEVETVISNGVVSDVSNYSWDLPATVTLVSDGESPESGTATVIATCQTIGEIPAKIGDINVISTPTSGWTAVENLVAANEGDAVETDAELRARQRISVTRPSLNLLEGTIAAIAALDNVGRYNIVENYTDAPDEWGNPEHSITCVVEGATDEDIAQAIYDNRGLGCYVNGDVEVDITDSVTGIVSVMRFYRPEYRDIYMEVTVNGSLPGFSTAVIDDMKTAFVNFVDSLQIGEDIAASSLIAAGMEVNEDPYKPVVTIQTLYMGFTPTPVDNTDLILTFSQLGNLSEENINITIESP